MECAGASEPEGTRDHGHARRTERKRRMDGKFVVAEEARSVCTGRILIERSGGSRESH